MTTCSICHFATELDDVVLGHGAARCICLRCYSRETGTTRPVPAGLRRAVNLIVAHEEVA